jgi:hypothetical protein
MHEPSRPHRSAPRARWRPFLVCGLILVACALAATAAGEVEPSSPRRECTHVTLAIVPSSGRNVALRVTNDDPAGRTATIHAAIDIEHEVGGRWERAPVSGVELRSDCHADVTGCVSLAPHQSIVIAPWLAMVGDGQCACEECGPAPAGRYRFVLRSCEACSSAVVASAPFTLR